MKKKWIIIITVPLVCVLAILFQNQRMKNDYESLMLHLDANDIEYIGIDPDFVALDNKIELRGKEMEPLLQLLKNVQLSGIVWNRTVIPFQESDEYVDVLIKFNDGVFRDDVRIVQLCITADSVNKSVIAHWGVSRNYDYKMVRLASCDDLYQYLCSIIPENRI